MRYQDILSNEREKTLRKLGAKTHAHRKRKRSEVEPPPRLFPVGDIPRIDVHTHLGSAEDMRSYARNMRRYGVAMAVSLGFRPGCDYLREAPVVAKRFAGRILACPRDRFRLAEGGTRKGLWWSKDDLTTFRDAGAAGIKIYAQYSLGLNRADIRSKIRHQGKVGLPMIGLHIADPLRHGFYHPHYWPSIYEAEKLVAACPETTFIMAHGFWLTDHDEGLDVLDGFFGRYPNLYTDLSACYQWWIPPHADSEKLRDFILKWRDRLLYGTDTGAAHNRNKVARYQSTFDLLETRKEHCRGFFSRPSTQTWLKGLALPRDVLNHIYWWNAVRTIPRVRECMVKRFDLGRLAAL